MIFRDLSSLAVHEGVLVAKGTRPLWTKILSRTTSHSVRGRSAFVRSPLGTLSVAVQPELPAEQHPLVVVLGCVDFCR